MDLTTWRSNRHIELEIDGLTMQFRRLSLLDMATSGDLPAPLAGLVQEMIDGKAISLGKNLNDWQRYAPLINRMVVAASTGPVRVTEQATDGTVGVEEIPFEFKVRVFNSLTSAGELRPFRREPAPAVEAAQPGDGIRDEAECDPGD